jgi:hypothetical protein
MEDLSKQALLKMAVEHTHRCNAKWVETVPVRGHIGGETLWEGDVEVFAVQHATAKICYAWSVDARRRDSGNQFATVLGVDGVDSALEAVKSVILRKQV